MPGDDPQTPNTQIAHVSVKPPPFWKTNPTLWFIRLEAQFSLAKITCETTKFNYVVAALDADVLTSVSDLLVSPPTDTPYEQLKNRLIESHSESESSRIRTLLQGLELGDQRPSQLLARMRALAGTAVGEPLLKSLWLGRLPSNTQSILAALNDDLNKSSAVAAKIHEFASPLAINETSTELSTTMQLKTQIAQLTNQVRDLTTLVQNKANTNNPRERRNVRSRSRSRDRSHRYKEPQNGQCFYHTNFGSKARKCTEPCSFQSSGN